MNFEHLIQDFRDMSRRVELLILRAEELRCRFDRASSRFASACHCMDGRENGRRGQTPVTN